MNFCLDAEQLRRALADIERAESHGFMHCLAVFRLSSVGYSISDVRGTYSDLIERAHPTDGRYDWGRFQGVSRNHRFKNGKLMPAERAAGKGETP